MLVPDIFYYSVYVAWCAFLFLFFRIKARIGALIYPLTLIFGGFLFSLKTHDNELISIWKVINILKDDIMETPGLSVAVLAWMGATVLIFGGLYFLRRIFDHS